jgi:hypothetical protein
MKLVIQIRNGQPFEHPIMGDNFVQAFPHLDIDNLPSDFAKFERVEMPRQCGPYQIEYEQYEWVDGIVKDVWHTREMTAEEKTAATAQYEERLLGRIALFKNVADDFAAKASTEQGRQIYLDYRATLDAFTWDDPAFAQTPIPPKVDANGNLVTTNNAGSAPNVIG